MSLAVLSASQGIWAEAGPAVQAALAATVLAAGALVSILSPPSATRRDAPPGLMARPALVAEAARHPSGGGAVILCELAGLGWVARSEDAEAARLALDEAQDRLSALLPEDACATRWSEERFLVFLPGIADPMAVLELARNLTTGLATGPGFAQLATAVSTHAGIALAPTDGQVLGELVNSAELALSEARLQGHPGYGFYSPDMAAHAQRRLALQRAVREAVSGDALRLDFQPLYAMRSGELVAFEALIRLHDPELGPIPPSEFIPLAEQCGLIAEIGQWAMDEACRAAAQWPAHLVVAVNLSPAQFYCGTLVNTVRRALQRHALPAYRLEVEITEGTLMSDNELVLSQLRLLRDMGVGVALDDFGTGYSSLAYLCKFPFSKLKIDRSFAAALDHSASAKNVLRAIVKLGHGLGMTVTAEGIETRRQLSLLRDIGCDLAQGYLLGRPAPPSDLAAIILGNFAQGLARRPRPSRRRAA
jgi:EAL domain-containing protein (putative c-di-GMP-specific phosphodiesterase class I)/GGDEF domain-containing protein